MEAYFMSLDIDMSSVGKIWDILDEDRSGNIELREFIDGCMHFRGNAKAVDIFLLQTEVHELAKEVSRLAAEVEPRQPSQTPFRNKSLTDGSSDYEFDA